MASQGSGAAPSPGQAEVMAAAPPEVRCPHVLCGLRGTWELPKEPCTGGENKAPRRLPQCYLQWRADMVPALLKRSLCGSPPQHQPLMAAHYLSGIYRFSGLWGNPLRAMTAVTRVGQVGCAFAHQHSHGWSDLPEPQLPPSTSSLKPPLRGSALYRSEAVRVFNSKGLNNTALSHWETPEVQKHSGMAPCGWGVSAAKGSLCVIRRDEPREDGLHMHSWQS